MASLPQSRGITVTVPSSWSPTSPEEHAQRRVRHGMAGWVGSAARRDSAGHLSPRRRGPMAASSSSSPQDASPVEFQDEELYSDSDSGGQEGEGQGEEDLFLHQPLEGKIRVPPQPLSPRFAQPNVASLLPEYFNAGQEKIMEAFSRASYVDLKSLPSDLHPGFFEERRFYNYQRAKTSELRQEMKSTKFEGKRHLFQEFEYVHSEYDLADRVRRRERQQAKDKMLHLHHHQPFRVLSQTTMNGGEQTTLVGAHQPDPYVEAQRDVTRTLWLDRELVPCDFIPAGRSSASTSLPTRMMLPDLLQDLQRVIQADWECPVDVFSDDLDRVLVCFFLSKDDFKTLVKPITAYMNVLVKNSDVISMYHLRKLAAMWKSEVQVEDLQGPQAEELTRMLDSLSPLYGENVQVDYLLMFGLLPPWAKGFSALTEF